jgi:hypothetical protein
MNGRRGKDLRALARRFRRLGGKVSQMRGGHLRWSMPGTAGFVTTPATPSDRRTLVAVRCSLRRFLNVRL